MDQHMTNPLLAEPSEEQRVLLEMLWDAFGSMGSGPYTSTSRGT